MIINNKHRQSSASLSNIKKQMLNEVVNNDHFDDVFDKGKSVTRNVTIKERGLISNIYFVRLSNKSTEE